MAYFKTYTCEPSCSSSLRSSHSTLHSLGRLEMAIGTLQYFVYTVELSIILNRLDIFDVKNDLWSYLLIPPPLGGFDLPDYDLHDWLVSNRVLEYMPLAKSIMWEQAVLTLPPYLCMPPNFRKGIHGFLIYFRGMEQYRYWLLISPLFICRFLDSIGSAFSLTT